MPPIQCYLGSSFDQNFISAWSDIFRVVKMIRHIQLCLVYHEAVYLLSRHKTLVSFI